MNTAEVLQLVNQLVVKSPRVRVGLSPLTSNSSIGRGRALLCQEPTPAQGELFSSCPLVCSPKRQTSPPLRLDRVCHHCFAQTKDVPSCSSCKMDPAMMKKLKDYHKNVPHDLSSKFEPMVYKLAHRLCRELQDGYENTNYILNLLSRPTIPQDVQEGLSEPHEALKRHLTEMGLEKEVNKFLTLEWYCDAMGVLHLNSIGTPIGTALFDDISYINHSCDPNVGLKFKGMQATVVALKDLNANDELLINYAEMEAEKGNWSHEEVQEHLKFNYGFDCSETCSCGKY